MVRVLLSIGLVAISCGMAVAQVPERKPDRVLLTLNDDPARSMAVTWRTGTPDEGVGQIAPALAGPGLTKASTATTATVAEAVETTGGVTHYYRSVSFKGLTPQTKYAYRVGDGRNWSEWNHFTTAADKPEKFSFIYVGDAQTDVLTLWSRVIRDAFRRGADASFIIHAGDLINNANNDDQWGEWFEAAGWINRVVPSLAVPGNHEHWRPKLNEEVQLSKLWKPQFEYPRNGVPGLEDSCYYLDYQGVRLISMDSNRMHKEQAAWLDGVLKDNKAKWTIVTFHHPIFSAAIKRDNPHLREHWMPLFDKYKVDLVLQGHDHAYGRSQLLTSGTVVGASEGGTVYVVSVSGPKQYNLSKDANQVMVRMAEDTQLFQFITVDGDKVSYEAVTAAGDIYDAFDLAKATDGNNRLENKIPTSPERRRKAD